MNDSGVVMPVEPLGISFSCIFPLDDENMDSSTFFGNLSTDGLVYRIEKSSPKNNRLSTGGMRGYKTYCKELQKTMYVNGKRNRALPVLVSFSTEDIHASRKISPKLFSNQYRPASFGYYECLEARGLFKYWKKRMLVLAEAGEGEQELAIVKKAVLSFFEDIIKDVEIRINKKEVCFEFKDGRKVTDELLSDGYKRLLNIVVDIAFRAALLNRELYGEQAAVLSEGTVLIDEIDMHLHPSLQAIVLQQLQQTFPKIQFIVSTHSPMVMSNLRSDDNNAIYKLNYNVEMRKYEISEVKAYGRDISSVVKTILEISPRNKETEGSLEKLFDCIDNDRLEEAKVMLSNLRKIYGDALPELLKAETMINFMSDDRD